MRSESSEFFASLPLASPKKSEAGIEMVDLEVASQANKTQRAGEVKPELSLGSLETRASWLFENATGNWDMHVSRFLSHVYLSQNVRVSIASVAD